MDKETVHFSWKTNLKKAGIVFAVGVGASATLAAEELISTGNLNVKKFAIGVSLAGFLGGMKSLQNWLKNGMGNPAK